MLRRTFLKALAGSLAASGLNLTWSDSDPKAVARPPWEDLPEPEDHFESREEFFARAYREQTERSAGAAL